MDLITIGEFLIDFIPGEEEGAFIRNAGGAPANVAISAARNGLSAGIYCKVGDDDFGRFLIATLKENGVEPLSPKLCDSAFTTLAFVTLDENKNRSFAFARKPGADMMLEKSEISEEEIGKSRMVHGGSFTLRDEPCKEATKFCLQKAHDSGKLVSFDINYRNLVWNGDRNACSECVKEVLPWVDLLKISDEEEDLVGGAANIPALMKEFGITAVIETLGKEGARCFFNGADFICKGRSFGELVDTTGAGDAFWGGFLSRLLILGINNSQELTEKALKDALEYGNISGGLCVTAKGAINSLPTRERIEELL